MTLTFRALDVERVGDVAGQTEVQGATEAFILGLRGRVGHDAVRVVELATQRDHASLHAITRLLTYEAHVNT